MKTITGNELASFLDDHYSGNFEIEKSADKNLEISNFSKIKNGESSVDSYTWILEQNRREIASRRESSELDLFNLEDPSEKKEYVRHMMEAAAELSGGAEGDAYKEYASYKLFEIQCDVMATPFALSSFTTVPLKGDEHPLITRPRSRNMQRFSVSTTSLNGDVGRNQWRTANECTTADLELLSTERIEWNLKDLAQGDISQEQAIRRELEYDMEMKIDDLALININASIRTSGLRDLCNMHPKIDATNIPDENYYDLDVKFPGSPGKITIQKLKFILFHFEMLNSLQRSEGSLSIQSIMMSPQNVQDPWDFTDLTYSSTPQGNLIEPVDTVTPATRESIFSSGTFTNAYGRRFAWMPNPVIPKGRLYITTNQPLGWRFTKPEFDKIIKWDETNSPDHSEMELAEILYRQTTGFYVPDLWLHRILIIDL